MPNAQLTRQVGEHLVVAELGRNGIAATPFAGNMPEFDIVALTPDGHSIYIQVKAMNTGDWQMYANKLLNIAHDEKSNTQKFKGLRPAIVTPMFFVLVKVVSPGADEFYVLSYSEMQKVVRKNYTLPKRKSMHFALRPKFVDGFRVAALTPDHFALGKQG